jgi:hypothetical protein
MAKKKKLTKDEQLAKTEVITSKMNEVQKLIEELEHDDHSKAKKSMLYLSIKKIQVSHKYMMESVGID